jgi:hypothetical protein
MHDIHIPYKSLITLRHSLRITGASFLLCFFIFSCAKEEAIRRVVLEPYTGAVTIEALKQSIGFENVGSMTSLADVKIFKDGVPAGSFNGVFAFKLPGRLRLNLFGTFGLTVMELLISGDLLQTYFPPKNIIYEWKSHHISFNALRDDRFIYRMEEQGDMFVLSAYTFDNNRLELIAEYIFDRKYLLNRSMIFYKAGSEIIRIDFTGFNGKIPEQTRISFRNDSAMEISFNEPEFDSDIPDAFFRVVEHGDKEVLPFQNILRYFNSGM